MNDRAGATAIAVTAHGPDDPTVSAVVLVHGALDRAKSFRGVVEHLPDLRIIEYDRRGYGESVPAVPPASLAQHVDDLLDVMDDRPTTVVAHSFGCVVVVSAAISYPERFRGLGLWEPQVPWMDFWPRSVRRGLEAMAAEDDTDALAERVYASMVGEAAWGRLPEDLKARRRAEGAAFQSDVVSGLTPPFRWEDLKVPSLFGVGLQTWPFAQEAATRLAESHGADLFTIAGAGHNAHVSHPEEFSQFVRRSARQLSDAAAQPHRTELGPGIMGDVKRPT
jgi:pimeloyl-ACP methyl ester carboxylesterase